MMRMLHRAACVMITAVLALGLCACNGTSSKDPLTAAQEKVAAADSLDATMVMEMGMEAAGESLDMTVTVDMTCFSDPQKVKAEMTMGLSGMGSQNLSIYAEEKDDGYHMYLFDGTTWTSQSIDAAGMEQYNAKGNLGLYLNSKNDFKESAAEQIDGKDTVKYTGVIKGDALQEALKSSGMMDSLGAMGSMGMTEEQMDALFSELNDIPVSIWIDKKDAYPVKCEMDMTETMNILIQKVLENMGLGVGGLDMNISKMMMTMTYSNFNQAADFTIPAEALAA